MAGQVVEAGAQPGDAEIEVARHHPHRDGLRRREIDELGGEALGREIALLLRHEDGAEPAELLHADLDRLGRCRARREEECRGEERRPAPPGAGQGSHIRARISPSRRGSATQLSPPSVLR